MKPVHLAERFAAIGVSPLRSRHRDPSNADRDRLPDSGRPPPLRQNPDTEREFKEHGRHLVPVHGNHRSKSAVVQIRERAHPFEARGQHAPRREDSRDVARLEEQPAKQRGAGWLELDLKKPESFNVFTLVEPVGRENDYPESRIRRYRFQHWDGTNWVTLTGGEAPAPTTLHRIPRVSSQRIRLLLESSQEQPHIAEIGVYDEPD